MTRELTNAFRAGELPITNYISQIEKHFEKIEPSVLAFIPEANRFERLQKDAEELVKKIPDVNNRPPLFGMTIGVKDIFHVHGFTTQAGSQLPAQDLQGDEAVSVTKLKHAGALILGKTVTTEFAYFTPGPTKNPHNKNHTPGGSSSGSAAAIGASLCDITLGTQTIGSVIRPAAFCGAVGFKPTYERISRDGVIPLSPTFDHVGVFTSNVEMAKQVASIVISNWGMVIEKRKPVLGIPDGKYLENVSKEGLKHFEEICKLLSTNYQLRSIKVMNDFQEIKSRHDAIMSYDASQVHKDWFAKHENFYSHKFSDLIKRGRAVTNYQLQIEACNQFRNQITELMNQNQIDLWICPPAIDVAPQGLDSTGDPVMCLPWTQIGFPAINIPTMKNEENLPFGLQLVGKWNADEMLLTWAEEIEKVVRKI